MKKTVTLILVLLSLKSNALDRSIYYSSIIGGGTCAVGAYSLAEGGKENKVANGLLFGLSCAIIAGLTSYYFKKDNPLNDDVVPMKLDKKSFLKSGNDNDGVVELSDLGFKLNIVKKGEGKVKVVNAPKELRQYLQSPKFNKMEISSGVYKGSNGRKFYIPKGFYLFEVETEASLK